MALCDDEDWPLVNQYHWFAHNGDDGRKYATANVMRGGKKVKIHMHRLILGAKPGQLVDHGRGGTLDNRHCNIRLCERFENAWNAPGRGGKPKH